MAHSRRLRLLLACVGVGWLVAATAPAVAQQQPPPQGPFLEIYLTNFVFDEGTNSYSVLVSITDVSQVKEIEPRLLDLSTGENVRFGPANIPVDKSPVSFSLPTDQLKPTRKYRLALRAIDRRAANQYVRRQSQNANDDPLTFASQEFTYTPSQAAPVTFEIDGVNADFAAHKLNFAIQHTTSERGLRYEVVISNKAGAALGQIGPADLDLKARVVSGPLPPPMEQVDQPTDYHATIRLFSLDDNLVAEQIKDFTLPPPPQPSITQRLATAFATFPWLGWGLGGIGAFLILSLVVWRFLPHRRRPMPRPHNLAPVLVAAAPRAGALQPAAAVSARAALLLRRSAAELAEYTQAGPGPRHVLNTDGATIGRSTDNEIVLDDRYVSGRQASIRRDGQRFVLWPETDASNPTRLNGEPLTAAQVLNNGDEIEMGRTLLVFGE
ncbi:MAG TPA: FHA domain-containing protein [Chloroflexota bacterium]|nr:FHA domain-containing protein [Chloroflexota bacterium]